MTSVESVWDALSETTEEAAHLKLRSKLMMRIQEQMSQLPGTQAVKAGQLGITQPRLNDLLRGKIDRFSLDMLVKIATQVGLRVEMSVDLAA